MTSSTQAALHEAFVLDELNGYAAGFSAIGRFVEFARQRRACGANTVHLDMRPAMFVHGPCVAALGAAIDSVAHAGTTVKVSLPEDPVAASYLQRNGFAARYLGLSIEDPFGSVLPYETHAIEDRVTTVSYVQERFLGRQELAELPRVLHERVEYAIWELRENAADHGQARSVHVAGQYFPNKQRLSFQLTDDGIGFQACVNEAMGVGWSAVECIAWATKPRSTTRRGGVPGGLGLKTLLELARVNGGMLQIVSGDGYWDFGPKGERKATMDAACPFTAVTVSLDTREEALAPLRDAVDMDLEGLP